MASEITVRPVSASDMKSFIMFPWSIYRGEQRRKNWVPPLLMDEKNLYDPKKNPYWDHAEAQHFLAYRDGEVVGRISAVIDHEYTKYWNTKTGFFGFYESIDDVDTAKALTAEAEAWLKAKGMERVIGPMNPSTNHILGFLVDDFDNPPIVQMAYTAEYYLHLIEAAGYAKEKDLWSYFLDAGVDLSEKTRRVAELARKRSKVEVRPVEMKDFAKVVEEMRGIYNDAWQDNWGFVPWTKEEFEHLGKDLKLIIFPELVLMAYVDGNPVAFILPIPDANQIMIKMNGRLLPTGIFKLLAGKNKIDTIRIAAFGVRKKFQKSGIDALLLWEIYDRGIRMGVSKADFSWILEDNFALRNFLEGWGVRHYKTHRIYGKNL